MENFVKEHKKVDICPGQKEDNLFQYEEELIM